jgi:hypothetical protein
MLDWYSRVTPTMHVDKTIWCSLSRDDQVALREMANIEFYENPEIRGTKLVWDIVPDDYVLDRSLYSTVENALNEKMLDRSVRLIRMIWNSRQTGDQRENEELLRKTIIASGKLLRLFPWVDEGMPLADFKEPNFNPIGPGKDESNWMDTKHFLVTKADLDKTNLLLSGFASTPSGLLRIRNILGCLPRTMTSGS